MPEKTVIIDFDNTMGVPGKDTDDGLALLYLLGCDDARVVGACTTYGNSTIDTVHENTEKMFSEMGLDVPLYKGAASACDPRSDASRFLARAAADNPGEVNLVATGSLAEETYLLVTIWAVLGFIYFRNILNHDEEGNYGKSVIVWVFMLSLVLFTSAAWMQQTNQQTTSEAIVNIQTRLELSNEGLDLSDEHAYIQDQLENIGRAIMRTSLVMVALFALAMGMMMSNYRIMRNRQEQIDRALNQAKEVAYTDPLTGVKSKNAYVEYVQDVNRQIESGELGEFAVVVCDVNGLKYINDTFGHKAGDDYIRAACRIVCAHFEHSPVFRIGGDEFVAVLKGNDYECRDEILRAFNEEVEQNIGTTNAVISAGLSVFESEEDRNLHDVFERADALMYERKMQLKSMGAVTRD